MSLKIRIHESNDLTKQEFIRKVMSAIRSCLQLPHGGGCHLIEDVTDGTKTEHWDVHLGGKKEAGKPIVSTKCICNNTEYPLTFWGQNVPSHILKMNPKEVDIEYTTFGDRWDVELKPWLESEVLK